MPERPVSTHPNYVTPEGLIQLQQQLAKLEQDRKQLVARKDDPIVRQQIGMIERDQRYFQKRLESAIPVDPASQQTDTVLFGAQVRLEDENGAAHAYTIVGEDEADIGHNKVSWVSPLARALIGHHVGESVTWKRPAGNLNLEIINIRYQDKNPQESA